MAYVVVSLRLIFCWVLFHPPPPPPKCDMILNKILNIASGPERMTQARLVLKIGMVQDHPIYPPQIIHNSNQIHEPIELNCNIVVVFSNKWTAVLPRWLTMVHSELMWYMYKCTPYHVQCPVLYDLKRHTVDTFVLCPVPSMHTDFFTYNCTLTVHRAYLDGSLLDVRNSLFLPRPLL